MIQVLLGMLAAILVAVFGAGCAGLKVCGEVSRIDAVKQTQSTFNGGFGDFWHGVTDGRKKTLTEDE